MGAHSLPDNRNGQTEQMKMHAIPNTTRREGVRRPSSVAIVPRLAVKSR